MSSLQTYNDQYQYFSQNREKMLSRYHSFHKEYENIYNSILSKLHTEGQRNANALTLLLRASTYLNTTHDLVLFGHIEEARILLRSPIELTLIAFLVIHSNEVYELWLECNDLRVKNTDEKGLVDVASIKDKRFNINEILKVHGNRFKDIQIYSDLVRLRGEFSTYYSHENLYNIVARVDQDDGKITLYIGQDADSDNDRTQKILLMINSLISTVKNLVGLVIV